MQTTPHRRPRGTAISRGFTLMEALITVAVCAVLLTAALPSFQDLINARRVDGAANELATDLQFARAEAIARNQPVSLSLLGAEPGAQACYALHTGKHSNCHCTASGIATCSGAAQQIKTVALAHTGGVQVAANVSSVRFEPLHGTSTPAGTFTVTGLRGRAVQHVVNLMGRVRSCSPEATVSGYRRC